MRKNPLPCNLPSQIQCSSHLCCCTRSWTRCRWFLLFWVWTTTFDGGSTILQNFKWWPGETGDDPIVAKDDLGDLGGLSGKDPERVVPEPSGNHKPWQIKASMCEEWKTNKWNQLGIGECIIYEIGGFRNFQLRDFDKIYVLRIEVCKNYLLSTVATKLLGFIRIFWEKSSPRCLLACCPVLFVTTAKTGSIERGRFTELGPCSA